MRNEVIEKIASSSLFGGPRAKKLHSPLARSERTLFSKGSSKM
jgi:hypothetical protein